MKTGIHMRTVRLVAASLLAALLLLTAASLPLGRTGTAAAQEGEATPEAAAALAAPALAAESGENAVELSWTEVSGAVRYELWVWWNRDPGWQQLGGDNLTGRTFRHTGVTAGRKYHYTILAVNAAGEKSAWPREEDGYHHASATVSATPTAPALKAEPGEGAVELSWDAAPGAARYELYVWWNREPGWQQLGGDNLTGRTFRHTGVTAGRKYYYTILAVSAAGEKSAWPGEEDGYHHASATVSAAMSATATPTAAASGTLTPTPTPTATGERVELTAPELKAEPGEGAVELSWDAAPGAVRYELYVWWNGAAGWQQIGGDSLTGRTFRHTEVTAGRKYYYVILAVSAAGEKSAWPGEEDGYHHASAAVIDTGTPESDRDALVALYHATDGASWEDNTNWLSDKPVGEWYGVTADASGRVTVLHIGENKLNGEIPPELGNLTRLRVLALPYNRLSGAIPPELGNLTNLTTLVFSDNRLSGTIPSELGNLTNLVELEMPRNELRGAIPSELGNLTNLAFLILRENRLSGAIPPELGNLTKLVELALRENRLSGAIPPELGNLTKLPSLDLAGNRFSGAIPPELGNLTNLVWLHLARNAFSGTIPSELGNLINLEYLSLESNLFDWCNPTTLVNRLPGVGRLVNPLPPNCGSPLPPPPSAAGDLAAAGAGQDILRILDGAGGISKYLDTGGIPVMAASDVSDAELHHARDIILSLLSNRPDLLNTMAANGDRVVIYRYRQATIPPGLNAIGWVETLSNGGSLGVMETALPHCGHIHVHEFAHMVHDALDSAFDSRLKNLYDAAMSAGLWQGMYASTNYAEYWAVTVQIWFGDAHDAWALPSAIAEYDPEIVRLIEEVFGDVTLQACS